MAHQYGRDWRIYLATGASTFAPIGGEGSWDQKRSSDSVDLSSKDDGQLKAEGFGQQSITFSLQGKVKLPDAGFEHAFDLQKTPDVSTVMQLRNKDQIVYEGPVSIGNFSMSGQNGQAVTYSFDLKATALPGVDDLTPAPVAP